MKTLLVFTVRGSGDKTEEVSVYKYLREHGIRANVKYREDIDYIEVYLKSLKDLYKLSYVTDYLKVPYEMRINEIETGAKTEILNKAKFAKYLRSILDIMPKENSMLSMREINIEVNIPFKSNEMLEAILEHLVKEKVIVTFLTSRTARVWSTYKALQKLDSIDINRYFRMNFVYECPICKNEFESMTELKLHYITEHNIFVCPIDGKYADSHMLKDPKHLAYAFLTYFALNGHMYNLTIFKYSYLMAKFLFNKV